MGDPAGVGPEIILKAYEGLKDQLRCDFIVFGHASVYERYGLRVAPEFLKHHESLGPVPDELAPGQLNECSGRLAMGYLHDSVTAVQAGRVAGLINAPVSKSAIHLGHPGFLGHTQFYEAAVARSDCPVQMAFMGKHFNLILLTHHQPLKTVSDTLKKMDLRQAILSGIAEFSQLLGKVPRTAVAGFNPHAGEGGLLDAGEDFMLSQVVASLQDSTPIRGPIPADSLFIPRELEHLDLIFACYHDQGLIPFKAMHAPGGFSITLGLQIPRVTVDHGTAADIAGKGLANAESLMCAWGFLDQFLSARKER